MSDMDSARRAEPGDEAIDEVLDEGGYEGVERGYEGVERSDDVLGGVGVAPASRSERHRRRRGGFFRRHKALLALLILLGLVAGGVAGVGLYLNKQLSGIGRFSSTVPEAARPAPVPVEGNQEPGLTFLLAGADNGYDGSGIAETLRSGRWQPGVHRSDTMMVMHISGDRKRIYVVSIPRDTYVPVEGHGEDKINAAFSYGGPGTHPFIMMSYNDDIFSLSTLAHELGHSLHSYHSWRTQPIIYGRYTLFAAEVASNFNQALVRDYLLRTQTDRAFQIAVIEEAMSNYHRYFFIMPTLARFELELHERAERGEALTAPVLNDLMADLFAEGYGEDLAMDRGRTGSTWAQFSTHLYSHFYVYQYALSLIHIRRLRQAIKCKSRGGPYH